MNNCPYTNLSLLAALVSHLAFFCCSVRKDKFRLVGKNLSILDPIFPSSFPKDFWRSLQGNSLSISLPCHVWNEQLRFCDDFFHLQLSSQFHYFQQLKVLYSAPIFLKFEEFMIRLFCQIWERAWSERKECHEQLATTVQQKRRLNLTIQLEDRLS